MKTFNHNFKSADGSLDVQGISGYTKALRELYKYLAKETEFNPEKRFIDAVPLLDLVGNTNAELSLLMADEQTRLSKEIIALTVYEKN